MNVRQAMLGFVSVLAIGCGDTHSSGHDSCGGKSNASWSKLSVLAGKPGGGSGSADGVGSAARFLDPGGVYAGVAGDVFVADTYNYVIRKIVVSSGAVTTIAGSPGLHGYVDGVGAAARFGTVNDLTGDGNGNLFVADNDAQVIRKIELATGTVSTIAGGANDSGQSLDGVGAAANFAAPTAIAYDGVGTLYIIDNAVIRQLVLATGAVSSVAGSYALNQLGNGSVDGVGPAASFDYPQRPAYDGAGSLFVTDSNVVRKIDVATTTVTTFAGSASAVGGGSVDGIGVAAQFATPSGIASDGAGNLFVADNGNDTIRRIVEATAAVTTVAGTPGTLGMSDGVGAAARFNGPAGIAFAGGTLFVADMYSHVIRSVEPNAAGATTTLAGQAANVGLSDGPGADARFNTPLGVATDDAGNIYVADANNSLIRKITPAGVVSTIAGAPLASGAHSPIFTPSTMVSDGKDTLYFAENGGAVVFRLVLSTGALDTMAGIGFGSSGAQEGPGLDVSFQDVTGLALDGAGNLYITDYSSETIRKLVLATGLVSIVAGSTLAAGSADGVGAAARFRGPFGIAYDNGSLYVNDSVNDTIRQIDLATGAVTTPFGSAGVSGSLDGVGTAARFNQPFSMVGDGDGTLYVGDSVGTIRRIVVKTGKVTTPLGSVGHLVVQPGKLPASLDTPSGLALLPCGGLVIADGNEDVVLTVE